MIVEEIFVPASGMAMEEVLFVEWLKQPGEQVAPGEVVALIETDKSVVELSSSTAGRLSRHLVAAGERVPGGRAVAYVLSDGEEGSSALPDDSVGHVSDASPRNPVPAGLVSHTAGREPHALSPRQRRAREMARAQGGAVAAADDLAQRAEVSTGSANRRATAEIVEKSWREVPHFSVGREVRAEGLLASLERLRATGVKATLTDLMLSALAGALQDAGEESDVGLAVATEWGVLMPVLRRLDDKAMREVAAEREAAVARARARRLSPADMAGPPFVTLSNLKADVDWFTGIVAPGQVALLTVGEVKLRPVVEGRGLAVAPTFTAVLTADHRRYDGADSARLLAGFARRLDMRANVIRVGEEQM